MNRNIIIASFVLALGFFLGSVKLSQGIYKFHDFDRYVDVKGLDERIVKSDLASWQISFSTSAENLEKVYEQVSLAQKKITKFLLDAGFQENEIERQTISVTDNHADPYIQHTANLPRYKAMTGILLYTNKIDLVAQTSQNTNMLIQDGIIITSNSVRYVYSDLNSIKTEMLNKATQNAREAAQSFAKISKAHLGSIRRAQQGQFTITSAGANAEYDDSSIMKKVRIVTSVQFFLE